ncbi:MAG: hypothetical protein HZA80_00965 [Candidatus Taylorbacteria bacterium]|nr:hypothetical protein [Candidatus Taylorbacteria bacterium]
MMYSFLPEMYKATLRKEYISRLLTILFCAIATAVIIGDIALVPSVVVSRSKKVELENSLSQNTQTASSSVFTQVNTEIDRVDSLLSHVTLSPVSLPEIVMDIVSRKNAGIRIREFLVSSDAEGYHVSITAIADTRDTLITFKKALELDPKVTKVELPVSDLAKSKNISFVIKVSGTIEKTPHE